MFGYVTVNEPELRIREYHLYRSYYCGMCMDLKDQYGQSGRMTLSYDTVFLALLLTSLYEPAETQRSVRCVVHPLEKHPTRQNAFTRYAADMNIILSYYSCVDDWNDEKEMKKKLMANVLRGKCEAAGRLYPEKAKLIKEKLDQLHELENQSRTDAASSESPSLLLDEAGGIFGDLMAEIFDYQHDTWGPALRQVGYYLGKFIYILDAYDDLEKDRASGSFNPLAAMHEKPGLDDYVQGLLTMTISSCTAAFETLPIVENIDILRNILYSGIWCKFDQKRMKRAQETAPSSVSRERTAQDE